MSENHPVKEQKKSRKGLAALALGCGCLVLVVVLLLGAYLFAGWTEYKSEPALVQARENQILLVDPYALSPDQRDKILEIGYPDAFTILFYQEETPAGVELVRLESWDYYSLTLSLTFVNGWLEQTTGLDGGPFPEVEPLQYYPEQFAAGMALDEVAGAAGLSQYVEIPLDSEYLEGGVLYYADGLSFGFQDDQLIYIEALAFSVE